MRYLFVGCFDPNTRKSELERLFSKYGKLDRVDMKTGKDYAFVHFKDERNAENALHGLNKAVFGKRERKLNVEWARDGNSNALKPKKTLFVTNFDPLRTKEEHIKRHFKPYGKILDIRMRGKNSFVVFATQEAATKALNSTQRSKILDRFVTIQYALTDDNPSAG